MTLQNNDQFLVDRGNTPYSVDSQTLVAKLQDSDLMLVCRSGVPYKATGAEIKSSLGSPGVNPGLNDITLNPSTPGSGTEADPYILQTQVVAPYGSTTQSVETITIIGQPPEAQVIWKDSSVDAGSRFAQVTGELTDASGVWTGQLEYADIPDSTEDTTYVGKLSIGLVYFQWTITQKAVAASPTSVTNVSLIEADPEGDRFTSQSFVASSQVVDGEPISTKTFDAHVDGTLSKTVKFTEPLESSEVNSISGDWQSTLSSPTISNPQYAFNSNPNNFAASQDNITWATEGFGIVPSTIEWFDYAATDENRITFNYADGNSDVFFTQGTNDWYNIGCTNNGSVLTSVFVQINSGQFGYFNGIKINGDQVVTGEPLLSANLTFANGTDMEALAAGDTVNQTTNFTEPLESSSTGILYSDSTIPIGGNWQEPPAGAFQGISPATQSSYTGNTAWIENLPNTQIIVSFPNKVVPANGYVDVWTWSGQDDISVDFQDPSGNALGGVNSRTEYAQGNNNVKVFRFLPVADQLISAIVVSRGVGGAFMSAIDWNGTFLADEVAALSFANGTDMSALEAGDVVSQSTSFTEPLESSGSTTAPTYVLTGAT